MAGSVLPVKVTVKVSELPSGMLLDSSAFQPWRPWLQIPAENLPAAFAAVAALLFDFVCAAMAAM